MISKKDRDALCVTTAITEELLSIYRHGLRGRLGAIRNASHYVRKRVERTEALAEDLRVRQMLELIDGEIVQIEAELTRMSTDGIYDEEIGPVDLAEIVEEIVETLPRNDRPELSFSKKVPQAMVCGDRARIRLALHELIENAIDAAASTVLVVIDSFDGSATVRIENDDRSTEANSNSFYSPFRSDHDDKLGIGFNVASRIAKRLGGRIDTERAPHITRITFTIPAAADSISTTDHPATINSGSIDPNRPCSKSCSAS